MATMNPDKAARMAGAAFDNGLRLHLDSITMYKNGSIPTSLQLSILAQEEIGKAFLLEEHAYREWIHRGDKSDEEFEAQYNKWLLEDLLSHRKKQKWFWRQADDPLQYLIRKKRMPRILREVLEHNLNSKKHLATYVGLTAKDGKPDLQGKITVPVKRIRNEEARNHITWVNDFLIELCEGVKCEVYGVETEDLEERLTMKLVRQLEHVWKTKSPKSRIKLKKLRTIPPDS